MAFFSCPFVWLGSHGARSTWCVRSSKRDGGQAKSETDGFKDANCVAAMYVLYGGYNTILPDGKAEQSSDGVLLCSPGRDLYNNICAL
jgi:hypothetical protein